MKQKWLLAFFLIIPFLLQGKEPNRYSVFTLENETSYRSFYSPNHRAESGRVYIFKDEGEGRVREIHLYEKLYTE